MQMSHPENAGVTVGRFLRNRQQGLCRRCKGNEHTLEEVGQNFAVTRERIRQIEAKALRKLRHPPRCRRLKACLERSIVPRTDSPTLGLPRSHSLGRRVGFVRGPLPPASSP